MAVSRFHYIILTVLVFLLGYLSYRIFESFLITLAWAAVLSILFYPLFTLIMKIIAWRSVASLLIMVLILGLLVGPISYLSFLLINEVGAVAAYAEAGRIGTISDLSRHRAVQGALKTVTSLLNITEEEIEQAIAEHVARFGRDILRRATRGVGSILGIVLNLIFMAFSIFFFLRDGPRLLKKLSDYMPFSHSQKDRLVKQVKDMVVSTIFGGVVVAMAQGIAGGAAFFLLKVPAPLIGGVAVTIASFLPLIGPSVVWGPMAIYLIVNGEVIRGVTLIIIGIFGIAMIDNVLRPLIIGNRTQIHFLILFFSVIGGIKVFGFIGFILGPLVVALFISVIDIFKSLEELAAPAVAHNRHDAGDR